LIDEHPKSTSPEGLLNRHLHRPVFRRDVEQALGLARVADFECHHEALHRFVAVGRSIGGHQHLVTDSQARMHDLVAPSRRRLLSHWRTAVSHHCFDLAAKDLRIEFECRFTLAIKSQIRIHLRCSPLWLLMDRGFSRRSPGRLRSRNRGTRREDLARSRRAGSAGYRPTPPAGPKPRRCRDHHPSRTVRWTPPNLRAG